MIGCAPDPQDARLTPHSQTRPHRAQFARIATSKFRVLALIFGFIVLCIRAEKLKIEF
jgi:hypothetical protein